MTMGRAAAARAEATRRLMFAVAAARRRRYGAFLGPRRLYTLHLYVGVNASFGGFASFRGSVYLCAFVRSRLTSFFFFFFLEFGDFFGLYNCGFDTIIYVRSIY